MTDKRLIDATEVERVFNQWLGEADSLAEQEAIECCIAHIHDTPAVDPKSLRGHARWVKDENVKIITVDVYGNTFKSPAVHGEAVQPLRHGSRGRSRQDHRKREVCRSARG